MSEKEWEVYDGGAQHMSREREFKRFLYNPKRK